MGQAPKDLQQAWTELKDDSDPLRALRAARVVREELGSWEGHLARSALAAGETWETIGGVLGISRQAAWERLRPWIATEIESERERLRSERARLRDERSKRWPKTTR